MSDAQNWTGRRVRRIADGAEHVVWEHDEVDETVALIGPGSHVHEPMDRFELIEGEPPAAEMTARYPIERGVPMPTRWDLRAPYPLAELWPGDSFAFPEAELASVMAWVRLFQNDMTLHGRQPDYATLVIGHDSARPGFMRLWRAV